MPALAIYNDKVAIPIQECNDISCGLPSLAFSIASKPAISVLKAPNWKVIWTILAVFSCPPICFNDHDAIAKTKIGVL